MSAFRRCPPHSAAPLFAPWVPSLLAIAPAPAHGLCDRPCSGCCATFGRSMRLRSLRRFPRAPSATPGASLTPRAMRCLSPFPCAPPLAPFLPTPSPPPFPFSLFLGPLPHLPFPAPPPPLFLQPTQHTRLPPTYAERVRGRDHPNIPSHACGTRPLLVRAPALLLKPHGSHNSCPISRQHSSALRTCAGAVAQAAAEELFPTTSPTRRRHSLPAARACAGAFAQAAA